MENNTIYIIITAVGTFVATVFGKEGWHYLTRRKELEADKSCAEKIKALENIISIGQLKTSQILTGVDMMLAIMEEEFYEEPRYKLLIDKIRELIIKNTDTSE